MKTLLFNFPKIAILFCFFLTTNAIGQIYLVEEWGQTSGMPDTIDYSASKVDGSGNIYVTTNTISATEKANILTTKYNSSGVVQWEVEKDNADENDYGSAIEVDGSGNVYVGAATWVDATNKYDYIVIKYNSSGTQQWTATYNGPGNFYDIPTDIYVDGSGNVYVTGYSYGSTTLGDFCTIKYNSSGTAQWTSRYDYASDQDAAAIVRSGPGSTVVVIGASENSPGDWDFAAVQYNASTGAQVNTNRNSASGSGFDQVYSADVDASGNIYISGRAAVVDEGFNMRTVKLEPDLDLVWAKNHDHAELDDEAHGVIVDLDDNVYVTGWVTNEDATRSFVTVKYNSAGTLLWHREEYAQNSGLDAYALKISSIDDNNIVVAGNVENGKSLDFLTVIYNSAGDRLWIEQYDSPDKADDIVNFVKADVDGIFYVGGKSYGVSVATNRLIKYSSASYIIPPDDDLTHPPYFTFFENKGQIIDTEDELREDIKFYSKRKTPSLFIGDDKLSYVWARVDTNDTEEDSIARIDMTFVGSNGSAEINRAVSQGGEYLNYYQAHCPEGITNVRSSDRLIEPELYDYVDLEYYFDNAGLKYYIIIKPGWSEQSDPISIQYLGAESVTILGDGSLEIESGIGKIVQKVADAYQIDAYGELSALGWDAEYLDLGDDEIGFDLGVYDDGLPLIIEIGIDEEVEGGEDSEGNVEWSTVYGGDGWDQFHDVKTNFKNSTPVEPGPKEEIYASGYIYESKYPEEYGIIFSDPIIGGGGFDNLGEFDMFLQKFSEEPDPAYAIWATIIGGSDDETERSEPFSGTFFPDIPGPKIGVLERYGDSGEEIYIYLVGVTLSSDYPTWDFDDDVETDFFIEDKPNDDNFAGVLSQFTSAGYVSWSTYVAGTTGHSWLHNIDVMQDRDQIFVCGYATGNTTDIIKDPDGAGPVTVSSTGGVYIASFNEDAELVWGTRYGDNELTGPSYWECAYDITHDLEGNIIVVGDVDVDTYDFPTTTGAYQETGGGFLDGFVLKFLGDYSLDWSTLFGYYATERAHSVTTDSRNNIYVAGYSSYVVDDVSIPLQPLFPDPGPEYLYDDSFNGGYYEGYIFRLSPTCDLDFSTFHGGDGDDYCLDIDFHNDYLFVTGFTTGSYSSFPNETLTDMYNQEGYFANVCSFITIFDINTFHPYSTFICGTANAYGTAIFAANNHYFNVGYLAFESPTETFLPIKDADDTDDEDYYQVPPNSLVNFFGAGGFKDRDYEAYISMYNYEPLPVVTVAVEDIYLNSIGEIFPNPTVDLFIFQVSEPIDPSKIAIVNTLGESVPFIITTKNEKQFVIDISTLGAGLYFLNYENYSAKITKL